MVWSERKKNSPSIQISIIDVDASRSQNAAQTMRERERCALFHPAIKIDSNNM